ncbi:hypothetical protein AMTRI_Chr03g43610 [Amborella trichopoda]|uniref:Uncharacterized protein n=1 Tax=Amborella trichopoda TaxID=13333 RepID=W1PUQ7_AMBTC|nr:hypothetical protein AMTR_s00022p00062050 [Amborella trichopoda]
MEEFSDEDSGLRVRSFRQEEYSTRRAFLRSYPLNWDDEVEREGEEEEKRENMKREKRGVKFVFMRVFEWKGKVFLMRKLKNKVAYYLVACHPFGFKPTTSLLSAH